MMRLFFILLLAVATCATAEERGATMNASERTLFTFAVPDSTGPERYDITMAAATLQGMINRDGPRLYLMAARPAYWLDLFSKPGNWLAGRERKALASLDDLASLAGDRLKGTVIWDPAVPATANVATTIAGVEDAVVLSPELADRYLGKWGIPVTMDLRGKFDGSETGSAKNDAYRWAIREYLAKGKCTSRLVCLYEDSADTRAGGNTVYVVTRDWPVMRRAFVFDLSPWGDERPGDDPDQPLGTDKATYEMMLAELLKQSAGAHMTELVGFFPFQKYSNIPGHASAHDPVPTEWETVWLISPYNCYQNTVAGDCYNQSFHNQAPLSPLKQHRPKADTKVEAKSYVCFLMADYDSAQPLYDFLPKHWDDPKRGEIPLCWGVNPNLLESYPDIIEHMYKTATPNDVIQSDASAAGYMNPNRVRPQYLDLFTRHNRRFFKMADMTMAPMVLDWDEPSDAVKDAFAQFAPDGLATIVMDLHHTGGKPPKTHLWKGMPVTELLNHTCNYSSAEQTAEAMYGVMRQRKPGDPGFYFFRIVWVSPSTVIGAVDTLRETHPELDFEVVGPYDFFSKLKAHLAGRGVK